MEDLEVGVHVLPGLATLVDDANGSVTAAGQFALNANPRTQQFYEALLRDISLGVSPAFAKQIARALENPSPSPTRNGRPDSPSSALSSSLGSLGDIGSHFATPLKQLGLGKDRKVQGPDQTRPAWSGLGPNL
ncbi:hypothetical protein PENSOL_c123G09106 [Penicillium solitum]|uniref:Uncharacterized protein n=1 Tax=Penicillium solitum TaxID=60172 RepID=A0A1V6Q5I1_9EURO|nr:uncharacterized protein PENSOL_c123G09106 [Penicillium solitum]OQD84464.1 hypothetical protein PENSOL_c123G09106 [Penicillium solitum]